MYKKINLFKEEQNNSNNVSIGAYVYIIQSDQNFILT